MNQSIIEILELSPVIPVVVIEEEAVAVPLAQTLLRAGIPVVEITLRSDAALAAIKAVRDSVPQMTVGVGTIWSSSDLDQAIEAGAHFGVSPGSPGRLLDAVEKSGLPFLPGTQTATEVAHCVQRGFQAVKFFPAEPAGGAAALNALSAVFPDIKFCPTGGIGPDTAAQYRRSANIPTVGGSWLTSRELIRKRDWKAIEAIAREAVA